MRPVLVIQLDNATPTILNREKSVTFGTLGTLALWLFTKPSPEMGELCFSVASMRSQELGSWKSHNGCSIQWRLPPYVPGNRAHCQLRCVAGFEGPLSRHFQKIWSGTLADFEPRSSASHLPKDGSVQGGSSIANRDLVEPLAEVKPVNS